MVIHTSIDVADLATHQINRIHFVWRVGNMDGSDFGIDARIISYCEVRNANEFVRILAKSLRLFEDDRS